MKPKKTREIRIEIERMRVIYKRKSNKTVWCAGCQAEAEIVTVDEAKAIADIGDAELDRLVRNGLLHTNQADEKDLLICLNSLLNKKKKEKRKWLESRQ